MALAHKRMVDASQFRVFNELKGELMKWNIAYVEEVSGVTNVTLYNWLNGKTLYPRIDTLTKVARVLGYEIVLKKLPSQPKAKLKLVKR